MNQPTDHVHSESCGCPDMHQMPAVAVAIITLSDTRSLAQDRSGDAIVESLQCAGQTVLTRDVLTDDPEPLRARLMQLRDDPAIDAIITTGGTGIAPRDQAIDVVESLLDVTLPGFGELFRRISVEEIGPRAILSRSVAGRMGTTVVFALPGSTGAVRTAMRGCVLPILSHAVALATASGRGATPVTNLQDAGHR